MAVRLRMLATILVCAGAQTACADPVEDFYRGRTIDITVPGSPGGDYDLRSRLLGRHLGRFIPGNPNVIVRNMPGGIGIQNANYLARGAPRDGTALTMVFQNMPALQAIGAPGIQFDVRKLGWIGNTTDGPNVINAWHTTGITTIQDVMARELIVGASGTASGAYFYPAALNQMAGTKFKIVGGYPGGNDINLAMEKGEVGGRGSNSWASWKSTRPDWVAQKKIAILVQIGLKRASDLPDVPLMLDLAKNAEDRAVMTFLSSDMGVARALATTPEVPPERLAALRQAFDAMMRDPDFLTEAARMQMDISPTTGDEAQRVATSMVETPAPILARAKALMDGASR